MGAAEFPQYWCVQQRGTYVADDESLRCERGGHLLPVHKRAARFAPLISRVAPAASYDRTYPQLSDELQHEWSLLDTHDSLTGFYKRLRTRRQVERIMTSLGAEVEVARRGGNGVEARCLRSA